MLSYLLKGMRVDEGIDLCELFENMIIGKETDEELLEEKLNEALCLQGISRMPVRVKVSSV